MIKEAHELKRGDTFRIEKYASTKGGLKVAAIKPGNFKSTIKITCEGGLEYDIHRNLSVEVIKEVEVIVCDKCQDIHKEAKTTAVRIHQQRGSGPHARFVDLCEDCYKAFTEMLVTSITTFMKEPNNDTNQKEKKS
jgi:hypothetical protein